MVGTQIFWSANAIRFDHYKAYSADLAAAQFLMPRVNAGATVAVTYIDETAMHVASATGILPYFGRNIYMNQPYPFYWWSDKNPSDSRFNALLPSHPGIVVAESPQDQSDPKIDLKGKRAELLLNSGYKLTNVFCGSLPFRTELVMTNCHLIFQYAGKTP